MINYKIGDLVTRINNSWKAGKGELMVPFSKENYQVLTQLIKLGVIVGCSTNNTPKTLKTIQVVLKENEKLETLKNLWFSENIQTHTPAVKSLTLVSKPGKRIYISYKDLCNFNNGFKTYLLRTSKGIITSQTALKKKLGGELLIKLSLA